MTDLTSSEREALGAAYAEWLRFPFDPGEFTGTEPPNDQQAEAVQLFQRLLRAVPRLAEEGAKLAEVMGLPPTIPATTSDRPAPSSSWLTMSDEEAQRDMGWQSVGVRDEIRQNWIAEAHAQRRAKDALEQIAEDAIRMLNEWDESMGSYQQGNSDGTTAASLAARLAEMGGGE